MKNEIFLKCFKSVTFQNMKCCRNMTLQKMKCFRNVTIWKKKYFRNVTFIKHCWTLSTFLLRPVTIIDLRNFCHNQLQQWPLFWLLSWSDYFSLSFILCNFSFFKWPWLKIDDFKWLRWLSFRIDDFRWLGWPVRHPELGHDFN